MSTQSRRRARPPTPQEYAAQYYATYGRPQSRAVSVFNWIFAVGVFILMLIAIQAALFSLLHLDPFAWVMTQVFHKGSIEQSTAITQPTVSAPIQPPAPQPPAPAQIQPAAPIAPVQAQPAAPVVQPTQVPVPVPVAPPPSAVVAPTAVPQPAVIPPTKIPDTPLEALGKPVNAVGEPAVNQLPQPTRNPLPGNCAIGPNAC